MTRPKVEKAKQWDNRVYLATYPRSGNHWIRYLIEEATGIATSSVYKDPDPPHLKVCFPWGGYCRNHGYEGHCRYPVNREVVVVKTHYLIAAHGSLFDKLPYSRAVRIIRHPVDSIYSYYRLNEIPEDKIPSRKITRYIKEWRRFQEYWDSRENVLTIRFEDLYNNPIPYLKMVLEYIGYSVTQEDVERAVVKHSPKGGLLKHLERFMKEDLLMIETELKDLLEEYGYELRSILEL